MKGEKFDLKDISLIPTIISDISSRKECNIDNCLFEANLPIIAAPMDTIVSIENSMGFLINGVTPCIPRGFHYKDSSNINDLSFHSFGLNEIEQSLLYRKVLQNSKRIKHTFFNYNKVLIDVANGHMQRLVYVVKEIKTHYPHITLMVGNIAHPLTFKNLAIAGADYIRCGIGTGQCCLTSANVSINYPMGSLIHECKKIKEESGIKAKIIADGGMKGYDDIIKALALGADAVMIGSLFNKTIESAGFNYLYKIKVPQKLAYKLWKYGFPIKKKYRGMSVKSVQRKWNKEKLVTSEGITKYQIVEYELYHWIRDFKDYLRSAMSYCGASNLNEFIGKTDWVFVTQNSIDRYKK